MPRQQPKEDCVIIIETWNKDYHAQELWFFESLEEAEKFGTKTLDQHESSYFIAEAKHDTTSV